MIGCCSKPARMRIRPTSTGPRRLMTAAASGNAAAVKVLIEHGADVNAREGAHGQTALMFAAALNRGRGDPGAAGTWRGSGIATKAVKLPKPAAAC